MNIISNKDTDWIDSVKMSLPDHYNVLEENLVSSMKNNTLDNIDAHGCALAAAIASGNMELAYEISVNSVLFGNDIRKSIANIVAGQSIDTIINQYVDSTYKGNANTHKPMLLRDNIENDTRMAIYAYSAALVLGNHRSFVIVEVLKNSGYSDQQIQDIANIAATVSTLSKILI